MDKIQKSILHTDVEGKNEYYSIITKFATENFELVQKFIPTFGPRDTEKILDKIFYKVEIKKIERIKPTRGKIIIKELVAYNITITQGPVAATYVHKIVEKNMKILESKDVFDFYHEEKF